jgi:hypothetical protein
MIEPFNPWPKPISKPKPEEDLDYIRAALELDSAFAFMTIPALSVPKISLYVREIIDGHDILSHYELLREEAVRWIMDPTKNVVRLG